MRPAFLELFLIIITIACIHTVRVMHNGTIRGNLYPANGSESVIAVKGDDSVKAVSTDGHFGMELQPGVWKVIVAFKSQTSNTVMENLRVNEGQNINLGQIRVQE